MSFYVTSEVTKFDEYFKAQKSLGEAQQTLATEGLTSLLDSQQLRWKLPINNHDNGSS